MALYWFFVVFNAVRLKMDNTFGKCEGQCKRWTDLITTSSMTQHEWDGTGEDPNRDWLLCTECSEEYTAAMQEQWEEYWSGRL